MSQPMPARVGHATSALEAALRTRLRGAVIGPSDPDYDRARTV